MTPAKRNALRSSGLRYVARLYAGCKLCYILAFIQQRHAHTPQVLQPTLSKGGASKPWLISSYPWSRKLRAFGLPVQVTIPCSATEKNHCSQENLGAVLCAWVVVLFPNLGFCSEEYSAHKCLASMYNILSLPSVNVLHKCTSWYMWQKKLFLVTNLTFWIS